MGVSWRLPGGTPTSGGPASAATLVYGVSLGKSQGSSGALARPGGWNPPSWPLLTPRLGTQGTKCRGHSWQGGQSQRSCLGGSGQSQAFCLDLFAGIFLNAWSWGLYEVGMHIHANHMQITPPPDQLEGNVPASSFLSQGRGAGAPTSRAGETWRGLHTGQVGKPRRGGVSRRSWVGSPAWASAPSSLPPGRAPSRGCLPVTLQCLR